MISTTPRKGGLLQCWGPSQEDMGLSLLLPASSQHCLQPAILGWSHLNHDKV